jgi:HTH-type transcriptional regulator, sugar sensing transcriptional regulator
METQLTKTLINLGLNQKEAKVYLACIEHGTAVVSEIAKSASINRVTTYDILEKLKKKGLVSFFTKAKIKYFTPIDPELLVDEYEKRTDELRRALPKLKSLQGEINHPRVRYFEGLDGIKAIYADTLTSKSEILNYSNSEEIREQWPTYDEDYVSKRAEKKIHLRGISPKDKMGEKVQAKDEKYFRQLRLVPKEQFDFTNEINIYDDKVAIISFKEELIGMIIESHEIANSQRAIFNMAWQFAAIIGNGKKEQKNSSSSAVGTKKSSDNRPHRGKMLEPLKEKEVKKNLKRETNEQKNSSVKDEANNLSLF